MATNSILPFCPTDTGTNLLSDAQYAADPQLLVGNQPGTARSVLVNKALRQATAISAGLGQFLADHQTNNINDSLDPATISTYLAAALSAAVSGSFVDLVSNQTIGGNKTFTNALTGVTPAQFDNSNKFSTTAFVKSSLGNINAIFGISGNTTLTAAQTGQLIVAGNPSGLTITLPAPAAIQVGAGYRFINVNSANITITTPAGTIQLPGSTPTSYIFAPGSSIEMYSSGVDWYVYNYSGTLNRNANGYLISPSGAITQWGATSSISPNSSMTISLPISFPTGPANGQATFNNVVTTLTGTAQISFPSTSSITVTNTSSISTSIFWLVTGF